MAKASSGVKKTGIRRRERKNIDKGSAHIHSTFNNTIVSITDTAGNVISRPAVCKALIAASRPAPGPLTNTSTDFKP